jgi:predicted PurR-regulated permease PerM
VVLAVMQLEGNVMQPLLLGRAVRLHPLAVVLAISAGVVLSGIVGALLAVPLVAVLNSAIRSLAEREPDAAEVGIIGPDNAEPPPEKNPTPAPEEEP